MKQFFLILPLLFSVTAFASSESTKLEGFLDKRGVAIYTKYQMVGEYLSADEKPIKLSALVSSDLINDTSAKGVEVAVFESKKSDVSDNSYIDFNEIDGLVISLQKIWNYTSTKSKDESGTVSVATKSGFSITLIEFTEEEAQKAGLKRIAMVTTGDALEELDKVRDPKEIDRIDGLAIIQMEGIKDLVAILKDAKKALI